LRNFNRIHYFAIVIHIFLIFGCERDVGHILISKIMPKKIKVLFKSHVFDNSILWGSFNAKIRISLIRQQMELPF